jgi:hypothetical protein
MVECQTLNYKDYTIFIHMVPSLLRWRTKIFENLLFGFENSLFRSLLQEFGVQSSIAMLGLKITVLRTL